MVLGADGMDALHRSHVAVFGLGGVGSYAVETLVRSGVGERRALPRHQSRGHPPPHRGTLRGRGP